MNDQQPEAEWSVAESSITYPFLSSTSPNFNSVPECKNVALQYGSQVIRNEEIFPRHRPQG